MSKNLLMQGDCIERMKELPDNSVDMVLCDLPYGTTTNPWDSVIPLEELWAEYRRVAKPNAAIVLTGHHKFTAQLMCSNMNDFRYKMVWVKARLTGFLRASLAPLRAHEDILVFYRKCPTFNPVEWYSTPYRTCKSALSKASPNYNNKVIDYISCSNGERKPTDVIHCLEDKYRVHTTQKPVALGRYLIRLFTNKNDVVLDNCFGSGSFIVAAELENRRFIGIERNQNVVGSKHEIIDCFAILEQRLAEAREQKKNGTLPNIFDSLHPSASFLCSKTARKKANDNSGISLSA
ncbi:DNA-methyltransferase [Zymomonas mobilis]|uniref:DNA-methyltransferase n=1 Tax=Zymomonas mobilis TaxID=542 RepID=UPI0039E9856D